MLRFGVGLFLVLHGLVHLLYFGQSKRIFELQPGMTWPDGAWAFSWLASGSAARTLASAALVLAAAGLVTGGLAVILGQSWWRPVVILSSGFSILIYALFWNGRMQALDNQGGVGILINLAILAAVLLKWPNFAF